MRRISLKYAKPGMELARNIFNRYGDMLLKGGVELTEKHLEFLAAKGVNEILIEDARVIDLTIDTLLKPDTQKATTVAMHRLLNLASENGKRKNPKDPDLCAARIEAERLSYIMVQSILSSKLGEPDLSGCMLLDDFQYVQPVLSTSLAILLAREAGYSSDDIIAVGKASILQNIGYLWLPQQLRTMTNVPTEKGQQEIEKHPLYGAEILKHYDTISPEIVEAVLQHHERWDGSGYPNGTRGWDISPFAQIIGIADTYYDMVSVRPARAAYKPKDVFEYIMAASGELFDPELVRVFARHVPIYPSGIMVKLDTKETGIIIDVNDGQIGRPVVRIFRDGKGTEINPPFDMDLSKPEYQYKVITDLLEV